MPAQGFALLGPYEDWMDVTNGFRKADDIGGPMDIKAGYRWNVPVLSYGFDQSFLDYFGSNGVVAVEAAIQTLNGLPPTSTLVLILLKNPLSFFGKFFRLWSIQAK